MTQNDDKNEDVEIDDLVPIPEHLRAFYEPNLLEHPVNFSNDELTQLDCALKKMISVDLSLIDFLKHKTEEISEMVFVFDAQYQIDQLSTHLELLIAKQHLDKQHINDNS
ncbi:hypothetical protein D3P96_08190 [Weissella viridescens]|uniref:Uncharacterized protein n=1 Tax=Weissella viridescens TaxID=1629 RepID=A0A3P2RDV8_WEIVI|nr:hypothetical protein [Weissella viridescens]RRG17341.1 hypothetical protein D3P96_08190 [Weissella viridescens]